MKKSIFLFTLWIYMQLSAQSQNTDSLYRFNANLIQSFINDQRPENLDSIEIIYIITEDIYLNNAFNVPKNIRVLFSKGGYKDEKFLQSQRRTLWIYLNSKESAVQAMLGKTLFNDPDNPGMVISCCYQQFIEWAPTKVALDSIENKREFIKKAR